MTDGISVKATGFVFENPNPGTKDVLLQHPSLILLGGDEMLATFDIDRLIFPFDYRTVIARSSDGGMTWYTEGPILIDPPPSTTHSIRTTRLSNDSIIGLGLMNRFDGIDTRLVNPENFGRLPGDLFTVISSDGGRIWTTPSYINPPLVGPSWEICHPVLELDTGRLLAPTATWRGWFGESPSGEQSPVFISDDEGTSWPRYGVAFDGRTTGLTHWEQSIVQLTDSRLLAVSWVYDMETGRTDPTEYSISHDRGETFSAPMLTGFHAQTCKLIQLGDERILCVYRRHDRPGMWATIVRLEGNNWTNIVDEPVWLGADSGMSGKGSGADELTSLKFGYPSPKQLPSGEVILLFWCEEEGTTNIRWTRLVIT